MNTLKVVCPKCKSVLRVKAVEGIEEKILTCPKCGCRNKMENLLRQNSELYNQIKKAIENHDTIVTLSQHYNSSEVRVVFQTVLRNNPQFFWYAYQYVYNVNRQTVRIVYTFKKEKARILSKEIEDVIDRDFRIDYVKTLPQLSQILYIYKWILHYTNYNLHSAYNQTIYSVFIKRNSVCTGYSKAVQYLCHKLGIECRLVFGRFLTNKEGGRHCWNLVKVEGVWYHLDVCLGEIDLCKRITGCIGDELKIFDGIAYSCFCVSTDEIEKSRNIEDKGGLPECTVNISLGSLPQTISLQESMRTDDCGCNIATVGVTSQVALSLSHKNMVVKQVKPQFYDLAVNERECLKTLQDCKHILNGGEGNGQNVYIEQATSLMDLLSSHYFKLTLRGVLNIISDITAALIECDEHDLVYRDIHIGNIYRANDGVWKLGDFGHCAVKREDDVYSGKVGSEWFMAPETYAFNRYTMKSQLYSVTMLMYFLLNGNKPALGKNNLFSFLASGKRDSQLFLMPSKLDSISNEWLKDSLWDIIYVYLNKDEDSLADLNDLCKYAEKINSIKNNMRPEVVAELSKVVNEFTGIIEIEGCVTYSETQIPPSPNILAPNSLVLVDNDDDGCLSDPVYTAKPAEPMFVKDLEVYGATCVVPNEPKEMNCCTTAITSSYEPSSKHGKQQSKGVFSSILDRFKNKCREEFVNACVYAPAQVKLDDRFLVQVFLYRDEETGEVKAKATMTDKNAVLRQYKPLELPVKKGDEIRIQLIMDGGDVLEKTKSFIWQGRFNSREFSVYVPMDFNGSELHGNVVIFINNLPAAEMMFTTEISHSPQQCYAEIRYNVFSKVFVSYSHKDKDIVSSMVEGFRILKADYFFDRHTLQVGDKYREEIRKWIDVSDVFVLCWSKNAAESVEVAKEKDYALEVASRPDSTLRIYPLSIKPTADLPVDMVDIYNFGEI